MPDERRITIEKFPYTLSRRCPECNWFLVEVKVHGQTNVELQTRCSNRDCKRRDTIVVQAGIAK